MERIEKIKSFVKESLKNAESGHDYWHAVRVYKNTKLICEDYCDINNLALETAALLHDLTDHKFRDKNKLDNNSIIKFLETINFSAYDTELVIKLITNVSFSSYNNEDVHFAELDILQDADRLDAIGAIGIARAFSYGGYRQRELFNPKIKPKKNMTKEEYRNTESTTINHFYEKLLLLKDGMKTSKGRELAQKRHEFMLLFLKEFMEEWTLKPQY